MGEWIEIDNDISDGPLMSLSHPSWVSGLKYQQTLLKYEIDSTVSPFMGEWIEIFCRG